MIRNGQPECNECGRTTVPILAGLCPICIMAMKSLIGTHSSKVGAIVVMYQKIFEEALREERQNGRQEVINYLKGWKSTEPWGTSAEKHFKEKYEKERTEADRS